MGMYTKITVALTFMGPDWWLKAAIEQLYQDGIRNLNLTRVIKNLVVPSVKTLGLSLSVPYIASHGLAPLLISSPPASSPSSQSRPDSSKSCSSTLKMTDTWWVD